MPSERNRHHLNHHWLLRIEWPLCEGLPDHSGSVSKITVQCNLECNLEYSTKYSMEYSTVFCWGLRRSPRPVDHGPWVSRSSWQTGNLEREDVIAVPRWVSGKRLIVLRPGQGSQIETPEEEQGSCSWIVNSWIIICYRKPPNIRKILMYHTSHEMKY